MPHKCKLPAIAVWEDPAWRWYRRRGYGTLRRRWISGSTREGRWNYLLTLLSPDARDGICFAIISSQKGLSRVPVNVPVDITPPFYAGSEIIVTFPPQSSEERTTFHLHEISRLVGIVSIPSHRNGLPSRPFSANNASPHGGCCRGSAFPHGATNVEASQTTSVVESVHVHEQKYRHFTTGEEGKGERQYH